MSIAAIEDRHARSLEDFRRRHRPCSELVVSMDKDPDDCFEYLYVPTSLGPLVRVTCCCGASWVEWDGRVSESPSTGIEGDVPIKVREGVRLLLLILKRPGLMFGRSSDVTPYQVEAFWQGWANGASIGDTAVMELFQLLEKSMRRRASEMLGVEPMCLGHCLADSYLGRGFTSDEVLARWYEGVVACLGEELPAVANEVLKGG